MRPISHSGVANGQERTDEVSVFCVKPVNTMPLEINTDTIAEAIASRLMDSNVLIPRLLTLDQAATSLGLTKDALKAKVHLGRIPTVELDKRPSIRPAGSDRMIEQSKRVEEMSRKRSTLGQGSIYSETAGGSAITRPAVSGEESRARPKIAKKLWPICIADKESWPRANFWLPIVSGFAICLRSSSRTMTSGRSLSVSRRAEGQIDLIPKLGDIKAAKLTSAQVSSNTRTVRSTSNRAL